MADKEKIKALVQRHFDKGVKCRDNAIEKYEEGDRSDEFYWDGYFECADKILKELDSLEPVREDLEEASGDYGNRAAYTDVDPFNWILEMAFKDGAEWQREQFEHERLKHCDELSPKEAQIESDFVSQHLKENNRTPTFIDAIKYGMRLEREHMTKDR